MYVYVRKYAYTHVYMQVIMYDYVCMYVCMYVYICMYCMYGSLPGDLQNCFDYMMTHLLLFIVPRKASHGFDHLIHTYIHTYIHTFLSYIHT